MANPIEKNEKTRVAPEKLDEFMIPDGSDLVVYIRFTRKAVFFHKSSKGHYSLKHTYNKRSKKIQIRKSDYALTMDFDGTITPGDPLQVFERVETTQTKV